ncbi:enoyl-CoA hydratase/isomerase family protein, partial [candidate division KSB1 bacterium]|nr:enoyl-CoA hydratase/isomerase family protein [candidate division KSB1 bacterium]
MKETQLPFRTAAVLGAGVMGSQIAAHLANSGLTVHLLDVPAKEGNKNAIVEGAFKKMLKLQPNPLVSKRATKRITLGNFDEHFDRLNEAEWIIEVVIENLPIKQQLMERLDKVAREDAIISSNTSGLPIHQITKGRAQAFKKRFLGTHFFNPPRYLKLLEIIPTPDTDPSILERIKWFGRVHLGKSVVVAKDTPNFIANRIGNYATLQAIRTFTDGSYTIEEIDTLTGTLIGHAKSATFRTADVVGLDTLLYVAENLYEAIPNDESREAHRAPELLRKLVEKGLLGAKTKKGFYQKVKKDILSLNPETFEYEPPRPIDLGDLDSIAKIGDLKERVRALYDDQGRAGAFTRQTMLDLMGYCARRVPEIADNPANIDRAICWGFGWEMGPFEVWDVLGFKRVLKDMREANIIVPGWVEQMIKNGGTSFYKGDSGLKEVYVPGKGYLGEQEPADIINLPTIKTTPNRTLLERKEAALLDLDDGVALYEFRSKSNSLGNDVIEGLFEAIDFVEEGDFRGLVIGNAGKNFSVGANLGEMAHVVLEGKFDLLAKVIKRFQDMIMRIRYARKPVVTAVQGMVLGGGCEMTMASAQVVATVETYTGLVELGAGLIPAGCGTTHMTAQAAEGAASEFPSHIQPYLEQAFQTIATAKVSTSAHEATELGLLGRNIRIVMNADRRLYVAKEEVIRLANEGYLPPPARNAIMVLGQPARATLEVAVHQMHQAGYASEYDRYLAGRLAYIMTGGAISAPTTVHENYLLELEREV